MGYGGESRKWAILVGTTWIQAFTGTNLDFSSYSSSMKSVLGVSQVQLNYLSVASDMGKALGWCSGLLLNHFPIWLVLLLAALFGFVGYGLQWLVIQQFLALPYLLVFILCLLAGCSICWFNTVCFVLCIRNFQSDRALALSLSTAFNGVSAALYTLIASAIDPSDTSLYLLLNAFLPLLPSALALAPILRPPPDATTARRDPFIFLFLNALAAATGLYLLFIASLANSARFLLVGALVLLALPLSVPGIVYVRDSARFDRSDGFGHIGMDEIMLHRGLLEVEVLNNEDENDEDSMLGEEHCARELLRSFDFWLYYMAYFCGGTIGLVYSNNIGQIAQSLGYDPQLNALISLYSSCSFFGRLLSAAPDFLRSKAYLGRTGWLAAALVPTPVAFFLLAASGSSESLHISTALIGLSSGFVFTAAVSVTSELFGAKSAGVNHNILITNIPVGSLLYGLVAALVYDANADDKAGEASVCEGRKCYERTFMVWGWISMVGVVSSWLLFRRTKSAYQRFERKRMRQMQDIRS